MAFTLHEVFDRLHSAAIERDFAGQVVLYTGFFLWSDGYYRQRPEPHEHDTEPQLPAARRWGDPQ